jgi:hypothetical protein
MAKLIKEVGVWERPMHLSLFDHDLHTILHREGQGDLISDILTGDKAELVFTNQKDDSDQGFQRR